MFKINQIQVTDEDIANVEQHFGFSFNDEQKNVIRFWDSTDIQACPGSGKTTTLAAKLMILAQKLPKSFHQGVCIITHTNTAIDEIKRKLGTYADFYNNYPHHFGTIQSFVDKFLAIPAYKLEYKQSPKIDTNLCFQKVDKKGANEHGTNAYLSKKSINSIGELFFNIHNFDISKKIADKVPIVGKPTPTYQTVQRVKDEVLKEGYLKYEEAYSIAFKYLRENTSIKTLFAKRFPIVFIDEMQDMETHQYELIQNLFGNTSTIIQKIGDINQSIFSAHSSQEKSDWQPTTTTLQLSETTRLSHHLAAVVKPICLSPQGMEGWQNPNPIPPTIIVFDDSTIERVKEKFVELIIQHDLLRFWSKDKPFKAIGQRRSEVQDIHLNINSYWFDFNKYANTLKSEEFDNLITYLDKCEKLSTSKNVKEVRKTLLNAICKGLKLAGVKNPLTNYLFTPFTFTEYLSIEKELENKQFNQTLSKWILDFQNTPQLKIEVGNYLKSLVTLLGEKPNDALNKFINDSTCQTQLATNMVYKYDQYQNIEIHFDTIHGAKGETHTATLYLETYLMRVYDIGGKILDFIVSSDKKKESLRTKSSYTAWQNKLPLAYVAMSRATHFLCIAVHKDRFENTKNYFEDINNGWSVEFL